MRRVVILALAVLALFIVAAPAMAQQYPVRTITIVVPYAPGGPTDTTAREIAAALSEKFKQSVIVENVTGASTILATSKVARAAPDGYTLLLHNLQISANVALFKDLPFNTEKDFAPVMLINKNPLVLAGRSTLEPKTFAELLALMRTRTLKAALPGYGTTAHLAMALLAQEAKVTFDQIPYRGAAPAMTDLLGGHVDLFMGTPQSIVPQAQAGKVKIYAVTSKDKSPELAAAESLVTALGPTFEIVFWQALFAPAGTPDAVVKTLNGALREAVADPALIKRWAVEGFDPFPKEQLSPQAAETFLRSEIARWGQVIRDNNITVSQQ